MFLETKLEKINPKGLFLHSFPVNAKCKKKRAQNGPLKRRSVSYDNNYS